MADLNERAVSLGVMSKTYGLAGLRIGLITNQTGIDRNKQSSIDLLANAPDVKLVALFSPEHGIRGKLVEPAVPGGH